MAAVAQGRRVARAVATERPPPRGHVHLAAVCIEGFVPKKWCTLKSVQACRNALQLAQARVKMR